MGREITMEELIQIVKESQGDFMIHVELGEEVESIAEKE
jgi:hypothetical protein